MTAGRDARADAVAWLAATEQMYQRAEERYFIGLCTLEAVNAAGRLSMAAQATVDAFSRELAA